MVQQSNIERFLSALIDNDPTAVADITPQTNMEHFLKECVDRVNCGNCPNPISRVDILLKELRDSLINGGGGAKPEQTKTVTITQKGAQDVLPDTGKTLSKVTVNVNVPIENKLPALIGNTITAITAQDLAGCTAIKNYAFYECASLTSVELPATLVTIGEYSFSYCSNLTALTIPASVTTIGQNGLRIGESDKKATITMLPTTPPTIGTSTFSTARLNKIIVPAGTGETYKAATNWAALADYIEEATA